MQLRKDGADLFVPDGEESGAALARTTHLGIGAHQDDLEIMAFHGVLACFGRDDQWFTGVTCTDGAGSSRAGVYAAFSDERMAATRRDEQRLAARIGQYAAILQLGYASAEVKDPRETRLADDLYDILLATRPRVVYTHNPADKHATHVAVMRAAVAAIHRMPPADRPAACYGCEVWRDLDWLSDGRKVVLDVSGRDNLASALVGVYDSQVAGGKRYDLASLGRRRANATYFESHAADAMEAATFALDLTPLTREGGPDAATYLGELLAEFADAVRKPFVDRK